MTIPSVYVAHIILDTQANNRVKRLQAKVTDSSDALERSQSQLDKIEAANRQLVTDLGGIRHVLQVCEKSRAHFESLANNLSPQLTQIQQENSESRW